MADATVGSAASNYSTKVTPPNPLYLGPSVGGERFVSLGPQALQSAILSSFLQMLRNRGLPQIENRTILLKEQRIGFTPRGSTWAHMARMSSCVEQSTVNSQIGKQPNRPNSQIGLAVDGPGGASKPWLNGILPPAHTLILLLRGVDFMSICVCKQIDYNDLQTYHSH
jgi:hypothetical protein